MAKQSAFYEPPSDSQTYYRSAGYWSIGIGIDRGIIAGGTTGSVSNVIDYITISLAGNATNFGDLTVARGQIGGAASSTRGIIAGGTTGSVSNVIDYVTIATVGNATDFGDLDAARRGVSGCSNETRGLQIGGYTTEAVNTIRLTSA